MKKLSKNTILAFAVLFFVIWVDTVYCQTPAAPSTAPPSGAGSILEPPGGGILDGVYTPEHIVNKKPIDYVYEREADIIWSKRVWRAIDLREKMNHPYYYPLDATGKRASLFQVLKNGIYSGKITSVFTFDIFSYEFGPPLTLPEIGKALTEQLAMKDSLGNPVFDATGAPAFKPDTIRPDGIKQYYIKEDWFFDKQRSVMDVRIISIAPIIEVNDPVQGKFSYKPLFWVYYPAIRNYLSQYNCYNPYNDAEWRTFDEAFSKRMFSSYSIMETNVYNRAIASYLPGQGMEQLLESERIKDDIFKIEHDMWNF
jgi:gliding motility associated protien GldN